jgi:hypothetical protein
LTIQVLVAFFVLALAALRLYALLVLLTRLLAATGRSLCVLTARSSVHIHIVCYENSFLPNANLGA